MRVMEKKGDDEGDGEKGEGEDRGEGKCKESYDIAHKEISFKKTKEDQTLFPAME